MNVKKKILMVLVILLILSSLAAGVAWHRNHYYVIDFQMYARDAQVLDLRGQEIEPAHYDKLRKKMPDCEIIWSVPFQGSRIPHDTRELTVSTLAEEDVAAMAYLTDLETVDATACRDYDALRTLENSRPELKVEYDLVFGDGTAVAHNAQKLTLTGASGGDAGLLQYMPELKQILVSGGGATADMEALRGAAHNRGVEFAVLLNDVPVSDLEETVTVRGITDAELELLPLLSSMKTLHLQDPEAEAGKILALRERYPDVQITWEVEIAGVPCPDSTVEVDLSHVVVTDLAQVERQMAYLPDAEKLIFGLCGIDNPKWENSRSKLAASAIENEELSAYRDRVREDYKVVWTVRLGPSIALRTDKDNFMPNHFGVGRLFNDYSYNLRYCEDMVCLDIGHMTLTDISFVEFMPKLKYLILAWTEVQYIEPIRSCKNLIFLELDNSCIRDLSPLVDCTALQDLNLGNTFCDITPVCQMTWLKNLYMIFGSGGDAWKASQALPNTRVVTNGDATVGGGWRRLPNYYDMRDMLGMYYMN